MVPSLVINVVGLTPELIGQHTPHLAALARSGQMKPIDAITPAVTCSAQATYLTGLPVSGHGIVGNGWHFRELSETWLWRQSNHLVQGQKLWEEAKQRDPAFTVAKLFWWYNMYSSADLSVTPRPMYCADGRKIPDVYSFPAPLRDELQAELGTFPLFKFWGPMANIESSRWICQAAQFVHAKYRPTLNLVYLPHLDYNLQRLGPHHPDISADLRQVDDLCGELINMATADGLNVVILSEYGITEVSGAVHINRILREQGWLSVREELGHEQLDAGASQAFAVADHQIAHIYISNQSLIPDVQRTLAAIPGIESVWNKMDQAARGLAHERSGELIAISQADQWFSYYYWLDDSRAPDYARTVDIHSKPGYDPVELFLDPKLTFGKLSVAAKLAKKKLGFRSLLDVIPLDSSLVKGSHGRPTDMPSQGPVLISSTSDALSKFPESVPATSVKDVILSHVFGQTGSATVAR